MHRYFSDELPPDILGWKEERNRLIHTLLKQRFAHLEIAGLAERSKALSDKLKSQAGKYNRAADKSRTKIEEKEK